MDGHFQWKLPNCWTKRASLRFFLFDFSLLAVFFGDSFGAATSDAATTSIGTVKCASTASFATIVVFSGALNGAGELSFLACFPMNFEKSIILYKWRRSFSQINNLPFLLSFLWAVRPTDSSRCFLISKSSFGWLFSKWFNVSMVPFAGGAGLAAAVDLFTRIPDPGDFDELIFRTAGADLPADSWRYWNEMNLKLFPDIFELSFFSVSLFLTLYCTVLGSAAIISSSTNSTCALPSFDAGKAFESFSEPLSDFPSLSTAEGCCCAFCCCFESFPAFLSRFYAKKNNWNSKSRYQFANCCKPIKI